MQVQDAIGEEGRLLTNIIEGLKVVIEEEQEIFDSFGSEAKCRFNYVFIKFIKAIASVS